MKIRWTSAIESQTRNGVHLFANFDHFDACIGVDRTNVHAPIFLRFGKATETNHKTLDDAKAAAEEHLKNYTAKLTT